MKATLSQYQPRQVARHWLMLSLLAAAGAICVLSSREVTKVESSAIAPVEVPMLALERRNERLFRRGARQPFSGVMMEYHSRGVLKSRTEIEGGVIHGVSEGFFASGAPQVIEHFKRGVQDGDRTTWHANGRMMSQGVLRDGKQEGTFRRWHDNGALAVEAEFKNGLPNGLSTSWYPSGYLKAEASVLLGEVAERHAYEDGVNQSPVLVARTTRP